MVRSSPVASIISQGASPIHVIALLIYIQLGIWQCSGNNMIRGSSRRAVLYFEYVKKEHISNCRYNFHYRITLIFTRNIRLSHRICLMLGCCLMLCNLKQKRGTPNLHVRFSKCDNSLSKMNDQAWSILITVLCRCGHLHHLKMREQCGFKTCLPLEPSVN